MEQMQGRYKEFGAQYLSFTFSKTDECKWLAFMFILGEKKAEHKMKDKDIF